MAMTTSDILGLLTPGLETAFFNTFEEMGHQYAEVATLIPSDKDTERYAWLGALPGVQEFLDERKVGNFSEYDYQIKNKTWESTISIDRAAIEDDLYGQIAMKAKQMGTNASQHLDLLVFGMLAGGFANVCFDGTPFFGSHTQGKDATGAAITQSNTGSDPLTSAALQTAITTMMRYKDDQGRPMGVKPNLLVVPPELYWEATILLNSAFYPDPLITASQNLGMNPLRGLLSLQVSPYLSSPSNWFLMDTKRAVKGIILQMRKDFEFEALEQSSETGFMRDEFFYGVRARYNAGYGDWRAAYGSSS
jgi:phage major head subunit gpT-like protein